MRINIAGLSQMVLFVLAGFSIYGQELRIDGTIYLDKNANSIQDPDERGMANIYVSNGRDVISSDDSGKFQIHLSDSQLLFVIKPSGYQMPSDKYNIPHYYYTYEEARLNDQNLKFGLTKAIESDTFKVAMLGDMQMRIQEEINYTNRLLTPELYKRDDLTFAIMLGDIADDNLNILDGTRQITRHFKMPAFGVFGNHDRDLQGDFTKSYNKIFGPDYYAFNYGKVHFIAINDVVPTDSGYYTGAISEEQLVFIENDLRTVPEDFLIVFCQHIPINILKNKEALLSLLENRKYVVAVSGHEHFLEQVFILRDNGDELHEVVAGAVCGLWWDGERDWKGIPVSVLGHGAPKGYYIFNFSGNTYTMNYKAMELPAEKQINIWTWQPDRGDSAMVMPGGFKGNEVLANVFAGSERTKVTMRIDDGNWVEMKKDTIPDPYVSRIVNLEESGIYPTKGQIKSGLHKQNSNHIWLGFFDPKIKKGSHRIEVKAKDIYGLDAYEVSFFTIGRFDE